MASMDLAPTSLMSSDLGQTHALLQVLDRLVEAREDCARWPAFLRQLALASGASSAGLVALSGRSRGEIWIPWNIEATVFDQWHGYFRHIDPWLGATRMPQRGDYKIVIGEELVTDDRLLDTEFFETFLKPNNIRWMRGAWFRPDACHASIYGVLLFRGVHEASFGCDVESTLERVMRRVQVDEKVAVANAMSRASGLDGCEPAVFLLCGHGGLVMCNERGNELLATGAVVNGVRSLNFSSPGLAFWLASLLGEGGLDSGVFGGAARQREKLAGVGLSLIELYPFRPIDSALSLSGVKYALTIRPLEARGTPNVSRAAFQMYRWTAAGFDTVRRLAAGDSLPQIAQARHCSLETVRSHLKNAKRKANVKRQVDLVRLMISLEG